MAARVQSTVDLRDWNLNDSLGSIDNIDNINDINDINESILISNTTSPNGPNSGKKTKGKRSVRAKYSRPCDGCALRKVRCDQKKPCSRCVEHNVPCTDNRLKKKCGPKHIHKKTRDSINNLSLGNARINTLGGHNEILTLDKLLPCLQIYQTWYYGIWPVLSVAHLVSRIVQLNPSSDSTLSPTNATSYSLCCAVCAAITRQLTFLTSTNPIVGVPTNVEASEYAKESVRARNLFDYRLEPSHDNLLISFFLYIYYVNQAGGIQAAILYMKEAISIAQLLGLHDPVTYINKPAAEVHRLRKIYYMLLVTERFMCIEDNVPVCLEPSIPLPALEDEEYSGLLTGFIELVKIFSIPDKKFFDNLINYSKKNASNSSSFSKLFTSSGTPNKNWIIKVQSELKKIEIENASSDTQRLNIILSKHWMRALAWHISSQNGLLIKKNASAEEVCLTHQFPIEIAKDFLTSTENLAIFAFESNGPGVCTKLLEIALAVADSANECALTMTKGESFTSFSILTSVFNLVSKFKSDVTIGQELYNKVANIVNKRPLPSSLNIGKTYIKELNDDGESISSEESLRNKQTEATPGFQIGGGTPELSSNPIETALDSLKPQPFRKSDEDKGNVQPDLRFFDSNGQIPSMLQSPNNGTPHSPFTQMTMAFSLSPGAGINFDSDFLGIQPSKSSQQPFQAFSQTHSPSAEQLQQLELQLQHQFAQFHQNSDNQYQYGTPTDTTWKGRSALRSSPKETPESNDQDQNDQKPNDINDPQTGLDRPNDSPSSDRSSPHSASSHYASSYGSDEQIDEQLEEQIDFENI